MLFLILGVGFALSQITPTLASEELPLKTTDDDQLDAISALGMGGLQFQQWAEGNPELQGLKESGKPFTLFHPTARAIKNFLRWWKYEGRPLTKEKLGSIFRYHMVNCTVFSKDVPAGRSILPTIMNTPKYVNLKGDGQKLLVMKDEFTMKVSFGVSKWPLTTANVVLKDIKYGNGVIHYVDKVFWFPRFASATMRNAQAGAMIAAINTASLSSVFDTASNITMFVPLDTVLEAALGGGDVGPDKLKDILMAHVAHGAHYSPDVMKGEAITMMNGEKVTVTLEDHTFRIGGAKVVLSDVLLRNGVAHVVDDFIKV